MTTSPGHAFSYRRGIHGNHAAARRRCTSTGRLCLGESVYESAKLARTTSGLSPATTGRASRPEKKKIGRRMSAVCDTVFINLDHDGGCTYNQHSSTFTDDNIDRFIDTDNHLALLYHEEIKSQICEMDEIAVLGWFILNLAERERLAGLQYGVSFGLGSLGALTLQDQMQELNRVLADLQMQTVKRSDLS